MVESFRFISVPVTVICICMVIMTGCGSRSYFESKEPGDEVGSDEVAKEQDLEVADQNEVTEPVSCFVQVSGEVKNPGVYELPQGSRIYEAVLMAGGITDEADVRMMNQASCINDGDMIYVPSYEENAKAASDQTAGGITADGKVNLNAATEEELMTLPGIGAQKAKLIVSYRDENGAYKDPADIMQIQGIKQGIYDQIKDLVVTQ